VSHALAVILVAIVTDVELKLYSYIILYSYTLAVILITKIVTDIELNIFI